MSKREQELREMKGPELIKEADKLGVKVKCDKARTKLVEKKSDLVDRILAFEAEQTDDQVLEQLKEKYEVEEVIPPNTVVETPAPENIVINVIEDVVPTPKRGALIEWNGKSQNICKWAEELGISANTLYGRIYKLGWTVERAFTTKGRK